jgi:hypothetical protein
VLEARNSTPNDPANIGWVSAGGPNPVDDISIWPHRQGAIAIGAVGYAGSRGMLAAGFRMLESARANDDAD